MGFSIPPEEDAEFLNDSNIRLHKARLNKDPSGYVLFSKKGIDVSLHYEKSGEGAVQGYVRCLNQQEGDRCPYCLILQKPREYIIIPAYSVSNRDVEHLLIPKTPKDGSLFRLLRDALYRLDLHKQMVVIQVEDFVSTVELKPKPALETGKSTIKILLKKYKADNDNCWSTDLETALGALYPRYSMKELRGYIPWIKDEFPESVQEKIDLKNIKPFKLSPPPVEDEEGVI